MVFFTVHSFHDVYLNTASGVTGQTGRGIKPLTLQARNKIPLFCEVHVCQEGGWHNHLNVDCEHYQLSPFALGQFQRLEPRSPPMWANTVQEFLYSSSLLGSEALVIPHK